MLSYRHAFHAGNHADVLKHVVLVQLVRYLCQKEKAFTLIDTHAGAGLYMLESGQAAKLEEYRQGIGRLWGRKDAPAAVAEYLKLVYRINPDKRLRHYPGSPLFALWTMRTHDTLRAFELHPRDARLLQESVHEIGKQAIIAAADGFAGLKALLPPPSRRGLALIDPSYEEKQDYDRVILALKDALTRFPGGLYALWYPQLTRLNAHELLPRLKRLPAKSWLNVALRVKSPSADGFGMHGSGMFILNPPYTLHDTLALSLPWLTETLAQDAGAEHVLEQLAG